MVNHQKEKRPRGRLSKEGEGGGDSIKCSGKYCGSCCGGYVADCVAVCCCPCAVLHCLALALVMGPYVVGRKCLGLGKKKKKIKSSNKKNKKGRQDVVDIERNTEGGASVRVGSGTVSGSVGEIDSVTVNAGFDAEIVWRELYQIGHLDFGRVSSPHGD
ncbi:hypothetical protein E2542_SST27901 [Spatholobus suberectus]|nr:hypothetical protein E2542_SST27901 [Spatholobus suberectus]